MEGHPTDDDEAKASRVDETVPTAFGPEAKLDPAGLYEGNILAACRAANEDFKKHAKPREQVAIPRTQRSDGRTRKRASNRLSSWQSRERKRIEIEVLSGRRDELTRQNEDLRTQNTKLRSLIDLLKAQKQRDADIAQGSSSSTYQLLPTSSMVSPLLSHGTPSRPQPLLSVQLQHEQLRRQAQAALLAQSGAMHATLRHHLLPIRQPWQTPLNALSLQTLSGMRPLQRFDSFSPMERVSNEGDQQIPQRPNLGEHGRSANKPVPPRKPGASTGTRTSEEQSITLQNAVNIPGANTPYEYPITVHNTSSKPSESERNSRETQT